MSFNNINTKLRSERGFTIVELLIVIVVIGILAAITIVAYNGVTARANTTSAKSAANSFAKKAEIYNADAGTNKYPDTAAQLTGAASTATYFLAGVSPTYGAASPSALTSSSANNAIRILKCAASGSTQASITSSNITGLKIIWFDYSAGTETTTPLTVGLTTACPDVT